MPDVQKGSDAPHRDARRREITLAAVKMFAENGYRSTTVEQVMRPFDSTGAAFYYYFDSKETLLQSIFEEAMSRAERGLQDALVTKVEPSARLWHIIRGLAQIVAENPDLTAVLFHDLREISPELAESIRDRERAYEEAIRDIYASGVTCGEFPARNSELVVNVLIGMANSVYRWYRSGLHPPPDEVSEVVADLALKVASQE